MAKRTQAPDPYGPEIEITLAQAVEETGLSRRGLHSAMERGSLQGRRVVDQGKGLEVRHRRSGGGATWLMSRGALHNYLMGRSRTQGTHVLGVLPGYRGPTGWEDSIPRRSTADPGEEAS